MNVWLVDIASGRRMRDRKLYYVHCFRLASRQKETVMQYILTVILIFLPWGLAAQEDSTSLHCHGFSVGADLDVRYDAENFFPTDYTFPKTARSNTFKMSVPFDDWGGEMEVYCNDGETCVSNIAREINEHGGYYYVYLVKIKSFGEDLNGKFNYAISSKGADIDVNGKLDDINAGIFDEIGAFSCDQPIPAIFTRQ